MQHLPTYLLFTLIKPLADYETPFRFVIQNQQKTKERSWFGKLSAWYVRPQDDAIRLDFTTKLTYLSAFRSRSCISKKQKFLSCLLQQAWTVDFLGGTKEVLVDCDKHRLLDFTKALTAAKEHEITSTRSSHEALQDITLKRKLLDLLGRIGGAQFSVFQTNGGCSCLTRCSRALMPFLASFARNPVFLLQHSSSFLASATTRAGLSGSLSRIASAHLFLIEKQEAEELSYQAMEELCCRLLQTGHDHTALSSNPYLPYLKPFNHHEKPTH